MTLVSNLASVGTAITLLCSELSVTIFSFCYMFRHRLLFIPINSIKLNVFYSIPYWIIVVLLKGILTDNWQILLLSFVLCCMFFCCLSFSLLRIHGLYLLFKIILSIKIVSDDK